MGHERAKKAPDRRRAAPPAERGREFPLFLTIFGAEAAAYAYINYGPTPIAHTLAALSAVPPLVSFAKNPGWVVEGGKFLGAAALGAVASKNPETAVAAVPIMAVGAGTIKGVTALVGHSFTRGSRRAPILAGEPHSDLDEDDARGDGRADPVNDRALGVGELYRLGNDLDQ